MTALEKRIKTFLADSGLPVTRFCKLAEIGTSTYYRVMNDECCFNDDMEDRIDTVLKKFGY